MSFDDPEKADLPYTMEDVEEIERVRGKPYPRLRATVQELKMWREFSNEWRRAHSTLFEAYEKLVADYNKVKEELASWTGPRCITPDDECLDYDGAHPYHENSIEKFWDKKQKDYVHKSDYERIQKGE